MVQWCVHNQPPRQGTAHKKQGNILCQDRSVVEENDDVIVAVLSDGLGQFEHSEAAADAITKSASKYLLDKHKQIKEGQFKEEQLKKDILEVCKEAIREYSDSLNISISQMDGTLMFVVLFKDASKAVCGQLGDGAICVVKQKQGLLAITYDDRLKASSNLTKTVLSKDALDCFEIETCPAEELLGFFLATDGLENELYSNAGKVRKKAEWYFNLISNGNSSVCADEINNRWDELTSDEKYGFTDDMSLIAIVRLNEMIELPQEANWLCVCGNRNRMESTRCESCGKDFLKVYKGIKFKEEQGNKLNYFTHINEDPEKELDVLETYSEYPLEFSKDKSVEEEELEWIDLNEPLNEEAVQTSVPQEQDQDTDQEGDAASVAQQAVKHDGASDKHKASKSRKSYIPDRSQIVFAIVVAFLVCVGIKEMSNSKAAADMCSVQKKTRAFRQKMIPCLRKIIF